MCKEELPLESFSGRTSLCRECNKVYQKAYYVKNKEAMLARANARRADPLIKARQDEVSAKWYANNKERKAKTQKAWSQTTKGRASCRSRDAARRATKLQQTPPWANLEAIDYVYHAQQVLKDAFPGLPGPHVDHSVPLKGERVWGFHTHENLVLMSPKDNLSKGNKFDLDTQV